MLTHIYNDSSHAEECSFNYKKKKKNLLKFLLSDIGFTGTQIPTAVQCQIKRKTGGRQQKRCVIENLT